MKRDVGDLQGPRGRSARGLLRRSAGLCGGAAPPAAYVLGRASAIGTSNAAGGFRVGESSRLRPPALTQPAPSREAGAMVLQDSRRVAMPGMFRARWLVPLMKRAVCGM